MDHMRIVFMGTPQAAVPSLERILADGHEVTGVWTKPDRPAGRGNKLHASPVKEFALKSNLTVQQPVKIRTPDALDLFRQGDPEIAVVVAYGRILTPDYLNALPHGCLNVHFSLLPKYRGAAPVNWAIANGEARTGVTTMRMDDGLDTGDILLVGETEITDGENAIELMGRLAGFGAELLSETLNSFGTIEPRKQDASAATYAPILRKEDGQIDWSRPASEINNRIRGFQPFPRSFTFHNGKRVVILKAVPLADRAEKAQPGTIIAAKHDQLIIACGGPSYLRILEAQSEGKNKMNVRDFLNGSKFQIGEKLS